MTNIDTTEETELLRRVRSEFDELPRMRLTAGQVARLLTVDGMTCEHTLQTLLRSGYLAKQGGVYLRADECHV